MLSITYQPDLDQVIFLTAISAFKIKSLYQKTTSKYTLKANITLNKLTFCCTLQWWEVLNTECVTQCNMYVYVFGILLYNEQHHWVNMLQSNQTLTLQRSCNHHLLRTFHISIVLVLFLLFLVGFPVQKFR